ncbi:DinB family protein [Pseudodesulfovibrio cashew]|uniref:DinB family protein n=1 Tax=Pseudodesulfovibrio cashew TaxID=2678688 RepID=A0A6I6JHQ7_9BACT|nr:DinB family protein [Pseudodesulfovibrio cashew]QGY40560.1 DinB family protein [Pseudodesulfovibrio cashew]
MSTQLPEDVQAVLLGLSDSHAILSGFLAGVSEEALHTRRGEGFWTIAEHAAHLAEVQPMGLMRITRMLEEDTPEFVPFVPNEKEDAEKPSLPPMTQVLADFKKGRDAIVEKLKAASPEDWGRRAIHPEYKEYGLRIFARHIFMHDHWHLYRMEELWLTRDAYLSGKGD